MFNKNSKDQFKNSSIIGESVVVDGNFECEEDVVIHGKVNGSIKTSCDVYVKSTSVIKASIKANNVFLEGVVTGNIDSKEFVEISSTAKLVGDISTKVINIEKGAFFSGKCTIKEHIENVKDSKNKETVIEDSGVDDVQEESKEEGIVKEVKQEKRKKKV